MPRSAGAHSKSWTSIGRLCLSGMSELAGQIGLFLGELRRQNASAHTVRNYASDLASFSFISRSPARQNPGGGDRRSGDSRMAGTSVRAAAHGRDHAPQAGRCTVVLQIPAARRFRGEKRARLVRTPKAPKTLPDVMTAEQTNALVDGVAPAADKLERPYPARDLAIFELLYGCGLRISELVGLNLDDFDRSERWIRVRGKGRKERQVPYTGKASASLERYLAAPSPRAEANTPCF